MTRAPALAMRRPGLPRVTAATGFSFAGKGRAIFIAILLASICFEGQGRKVFPFVPSIVFYFLKDAVLVYGFFLGIKPDVSALAKKLYGGFTIILAISIMFTVIQILNPEHQSFLLGLVGVRAYWLWWLAPLVVASCISTEKDLERVVWAFSTITVVVAGVAIWQFSLPANEPANAYALYDGEQVMEVAVVSTTGRARVASTFSYISGFTDFVVLAPMFLLTIGLNARAGMVRTVSLVGFVASVVALPTSGSRGPVAMAAAGVLLVAWQGGLLLTPMGRRALAAVAVAGVATLAWMPDAVQGVRDRFDHSDTEGRIMESFQVLPPVALMTLEYPALGIGTGMQHNAMGAFGVSPPIAAEGEVGRLLNELGPAGYLFVWLTRLGLSIALLRLAGELRKAGRRAGAGLGYVLAYYALTSAMVFDHIWQALYFVGVGLLFALYRLTVIAQMTAGPVMAPPVKVANNRIRRRPPVAPPLRCLPLPQNRTSNRTG